MLLYALRDLVGLGSYILELRHMKMAKLPSPLSGRFYPQVIFILLVTFNRANLIFFNFMACENSTNFVGINMIRIFPR